MIDLYDRLNARNMKVIEMPKWGVYLRKRWEETFVYHLSEEEKESIFLHGDRSFCGFLWHVFSYERKDCFESEKAEDLFQKQSKNECYVFYQLSDYALLLENASGLIVEDLRDEEDIYIVDKEFSWTYVQTHDSEGFGPYFSHKSS
jgi:argonaute-like protein implicated in RNA metabolism and viral defense